MDGSKNADEISFSLRGSDYTIDLGKKNLAALERALKPYIDDASKGSKASTKRRSSETANSGPGLTEIRAWAKGAGIEVSERGRISKTDREQYEAAHGN